MKHTRFFEVISAIRKEDLRLLEDFIISPVFNKNRRIVSAFGFIKKRISEDTSSELRYEDLQKAAGIVKSANFRVFLSDFTGLLEEFLVYRKGNPYKEIELLSLFGLLGLRKSFDKLSKDLYKKFSSKICKDTFDYYMLYAIEAEIILHYSMIKSDKKKNENRIKQFGRLDELVDLIFISLKLDTVIRLLMQGIKRSDSTGMLKKGFLKMQISKMEHPFIYSKLLVIKLISGETKNPSEIERLAEEHISEKGFFVYISDVLLWYYRKAGNHTKEFELLKKLDTMGLIKNVTSENFIQFIDSGLAAGELSRVINYFYKQSKLRDKDTVSFAKAKIELYKHNYETALAELNKLNTKPCAAKEGQKNDYYEAASLMKQHIYKITGETELLCYAADAYRKKKRRKLSRCKAE